MKLVEVFISFYHSILAIPFAIKLSKYHPKTLLFLEHDIKVEHLIRGLSPSGALRSNVC